MMFNCHCRTCQQVTGGPYAPVIIVSLKGFKITKGTLSYNFTERLLGGQHKRGFCGQCGSRLTGAQNDLEESRWIGITASSLDDPSWFKPTADIFVSHAQPWDLMDPNLPKHKESFPQK